jgi:hypothetical protein
MDAMVTICLPFQDDGMHNIHIKEDENVQSVQGRSLGNKFGDKFFGFQWFSPVFAQSYGLASQRKKSRSFSIFTSFTRF